MPTDFTVPKTFVTLPEGVISACKPLFSWGRSALPTLAVTTHEVVEITTIWAVDEDVEALAEGDDAPAPAEEEPADADDEPAEAVPPTLSPTATLTCATVPAIGEVIDAAARAVSESASLA
jgi:hypothetical protein